MELWLTPNNAPSMPSMAGALEAGFSHPAGPSQTLPNPPGDSQKYHKLLWADWETDLSSSEPGGGGQGQVRHV